MQILKKIIISNAEPPSDCLWAKPVGAGFIFYLLNNGRWQPMKIVDDYDTATTEDDKAFGPSDIVGEYTDTIWDK